MRDAKILNRIGYDNKCLCFDDAITDILKHAESNWMKLDDDADYFFCFDLSKLRVFNYRKTIKLH